MNAPLPRIATALPLGELALSMLGASLGSTSAGALDRAHADVPEAAWLAERVAATAAAGTSHADLVGAWLADPHPADLQLSGLAAALQLSLAETLAVALACAAETHSMVARVLSWLQAPVGAARPTVGLVMRIAQGLGEPRAFADLVSGLAVQAGLLRIEAGARATVEAALSVPTPLVLALMQPATLHWPGLTIGLDSGMALPDNTRQGCADYARALEQGATATLAVRSRHPAEARAVAAEIAHQMRVRPVFIDGDVPPGVGPWLWLASAVPVLCLELAPGERHRLAPIAGWQGPLLVACGLEGHIDFNGHTVPGWHAPLPPAPQRAQLWATVLGNREVAEDLGHRHRHAAGRIAELAAAARLQAQLAGCNEVSGAHVSQAARAGVGGDLGELAELVPDEIAAEALVLAPSVRDELEALARRCLHRDALASQLGPAVRARLRHGVRALFVGGSGTGKSLAVGWLATRLGLPLYRVDLAAMTSKYIGETEKNLARLFARAEHAEVVLMFDEADALFGKRTEVKDSNDRFANGQTNYLLSRIESFEGIAVLTSNSRARFDSGFTRRLDAIIDFPSPAAEERRALWLAHLGSRHALDDEALNRLAAGCDLPGGHVRNVTLAAASAVPTGEPITYADVVQALRAELRKLGRGLPAGL